MNDTEILKIIDLINNNETEKAVQTLREMLIKTESKDKYDIVKLVKQIILTKDVINARPVLATINHNEKGEQIICNGFVGIKWKINEPCLDIFNQTSAEESFKLDNIFSTEKEVETTENDLLIINNLTKCINYIKSNTTDKEYKGTMCFLFGKIFDLSVVGQVLKICLSYNGELTITGAEDLARPIQLENSHIKAIILPCRITEETDFDKIKEQTEDMCNLLRNKE